MKTFFTTNLIKFAITSILLTVMFRYFLSMGIANQNNILIIASALTYGILMGFSGYYFGSKEYEELPIYDIGFRWHLTTFIVHNSISVLWFVFDFQSKYETINVIYVTTIAWSVFLLIHLFIYLSMRKNAIKQLDKEELFE